MRSPSIIGSFSVVSFSMLTLLPIAATISDTLTVAQTLKVGQTLVSASEVFELGFFSPNNSSVKLYLGIWYKEVAEQTVVWVANRDRGVKSSAVLKISRNGNLIIYRASTPIWSSNQTSSSNNTVAQLLDSGNFVLRSANDSDPTNFLWQSFDYPTNTLLPGMKLGWDSKTGLNRYLNSWKTSNDPSPGDYSFKFYLKGFPELYLRNKQVIQYRLGPWNGVRFSGFPEMNQTNIFNFSFIMNPNEVTYSFEILDKATYSQLILTPFGVLQRYTWTDSVRGWKLFWYAPKDQCDSYKECGAYGVCGTDYSPVCQCVRGFKPQNSKAWALRHGSGGCVSISKLGCGGDGFLALKNMKLPVMATAFVNGGMNLVQCEKACLMNCSCSAFSIMDTRGGGSGCLIWIGDLIDMRHYSADKGGQDLFVRVAASDLEAGRIVSRKSFEEISLMIGLTVAAACVLLGLSICFAWKRKGIQRALEEKIERPHEARQDLLISDGINVSNRRYSGENPTVELEILLFDFGTISIATNKFSEENKLGEGGFGCVYKGILVDGQEIAVKRLSTYSGQGTEEFRNEVRLIARVQHRNLVRLLGCCIEKEEKMLIYEHMENRSLDSILFDPVKCSTLNWKRRFNIICGIARGLLYLHQESRFRIIHRDLKVSNILLDGEMNPKISDFGMARIFGGDQTEANTVRVVGTFGYMSPEYVRDGIFSVKSDVFSFGVLLLEIISGKKNRRFYNAQQGLTLLGHAWWLWEQGKGIELLDTSAGECYPTCEVMRCIQVALLCVQQRAEDRPNVSSVVLMLSSNEAASLSQPKLPGFSIRRRQLKTHSSFPKKYELFTMNELTVTNLEGR